VRGSTVSILGRMSSTPAGERQMANAVISVSDYHGELSPLGMKSVTVGGANRGAPGAGLGQYGVTGSISLNNIGLLVRVWGRITATGTGWVEISDGGATVRVDTSNLNTSYNIKDYIVVTGISSLYKSGDNYLPLAIPRGDSDVTQL
jgi:hypothetical protein